MGKVGSRTFRYCVKRLEALASCPEFEVPETYFSQITPLVIDALSEFTASAGAFGNKNDRIEVAKRFRTLGSYIGQRSAILAVQELHFSPHIRDHIAPWLRDDLKNVYRMLKRRGDYVAPPLPMPITRVLDRESDYD